MLQTLGNVYLMLWMKNIHVSSTDQTGMGRDWSWVIKWANHNSPRSPPESKEGQRLQGRGMLRKVSWLLLFFPGYPLVVPAAERALSREMLGLNQYSHSNFHKLFIVWGCLGRLIVVRIHGSGQIPSSAIHQHKIYDLRVFFNSFNGRREIWVWRN